MDGTSSGRDKWGAAPIEAGFTLLPNHLIGINQFAEEEKQLSPTEMIVLLQILAAWWSKDRLPFPSKATIAARAGLSPRQVQRALTSLETKGYIERVKRFARNQARTSNQYDLAGLVAAVYSVAEKHPNAFKRQGSNSSQVKEEDTLKKQSPRLLGEGSE